jgi:nucleoside-diphosphate-sugar epimerase
VAVTVVTGSGGLIGSESVRYFARQGFDVFGIEGDMRAHFFGPEASTAHATAALDDIEDMLRDIHDANRERWLEPARTRKADDHADR